jgi:methylated-DNA-protein-cysteine methyltransferase-like protein
MRADLKTKALSNRFPPNQFAREQAKRQLQRDALRPNDLRDIAFRHMILAIPPGKVSTYGGVAAAAGYPRYHRAVARLLRTDPVDQLPWHRVLGAGGEIKLRGHAAHEQRARLKLEGIQFNGKRVDMDRFEHSLKPWEIYR